jgi:hypothetical protein
MELIGIPTSVADRPFIGAAERQFTIGQPTRQMELDLIDFNV